MSCVNSFKFSYYAGPAFTLIYVVAGLPLARLADTRSRSLVLVIGLVFWSVMVLLTGFAMVFWQLVVLRIMLGIGEVCAVFHTGITTFSKTSRWRS